MELAVCFDLGHEDDKYDVVGVLQCFVVYCAVISAGSRIGCLHGCGTTCTKYDT